MQSLKSKPLVVAAAFSAAALALVFLAVAPLIASIGDAGSQAVQQQAQIADYDRRLSSAREFIAFAKIENDNFAKMNEVFVDGQMPLDFINSLETAAANCNVSVKFSPSVSQQTSNKDWSSITIEADIAGGVSDILRFMEKIENSPYLLTVQSFGLRAGSAGDEANDIPAGSGNAHILLKAYAK